MSTSLTDIHQDLAFFYGDDTPPVVTDTEYTRRTRFINNQIKRIYNLKEWPNLATLATISLTSGVATISLRDNGVLDLREVKDGTDNVFSKVDYSDFDNYDTGSYVYYPTNSGLVTNQPTLTSLTCKYIPSAPSLATSADTTILPSSLIAKGALVEIRKQEDPEFDVSQDRQAYQEELREYIALLNRGDRKQITSTYELE